MRIARLARVQEILGFRQPGGEAMGSQVQFNGTRSVLSHCPDALDAGDEGLDLVWALYGVEAQSTNCEGSIGASTVAGVVSERDGTHRVARRRKCLNGYITGGKDLAVTDHEVGLDHCPRTRASSQLRRRFGGFTPALTRHGSASGAPATTSVAPRRRRGQSGHA